jgi:RNA polymerase sigma-70 factor (ECF subfamily)
MCDDLEAIRRCLAGDENAYRDLIGRYRRQVYSLALRMVRQSEDAEDLTQETFVRMFRALDRYDPTRSFTAWLFTITSRLCIDHLRRRKLAPLPLHHREAGSDEEYVIDIEDTEPRPDEVTQRGEEEHRVQRLIDGLPAHYRIVVMLRHQQDLSYDEIAEALGIPLGTVKARIHRARALLAERLKGERS